MYEVAEDRAGDTDESCHGMIQPINNWSVRELAKCHKGKTSRSLIHSHGDEGTWADDRHRSVLHIRPSPHLGPHMCVSPY
jgi:hypothetical protein